MVVRVAEDEAYEVALIREQDSDRAEPVLVLQISTLPQFFSLRRIQSWRNLSSR